VAKPSLIRDIHQVSVLNLLRRHGSTSRARLAQDLGLTRSTLSSLINQLSDDGYVVETGHQIVRRGTGRPGVGLELNAAGATFLGADVGYGNLRVVRLDLAASLVDQEHAVFDLATPPRDVVRRLAAMVSEVASRGGGDPSRTKGLGVAVPGTANGGRIVLSPGLGWRDVDVATELATAVDCPVLIENNANAAALAEAYLCEPDGGRNMVFVHLGNGIGSGIVRNGEIYRGSFGAAGEIGNIRLAPDGPVDRKGNRGTFEAFANTGAVLRLHAEAGGRPTDLAGFLREVASGTEAAGATASTWSRYVGQVILMLVNVLNPEKIVLGGPLAPLAAVALPALEQLVRREQLPGSDEVALRVSTLGDDTNALGGAMLVYHTMFSLPGLDVAGTSDLPSALPTL
jgi:predicted NBD/HSP70 family sugar kinase/biotin operon repressor